MNKKYNILYVDDEISNLNIFKNTFRRNYNIFTAETAQEGIRIMENQNIDLILTDQRMPEMTGVDFLKSIMVKYPHPNRILITAYTDFDALKDAVNEAKIFQYIQKPWEEREIQQVIDSALDMYELKQKNIELTEQLKKNNEELERINKELIEIDRLKFQFLNIISHELRTPLNGLVGAMALFKSKFKS
ncbi:MAG: response regulator, partial [Bacteroidales bacterium]|nr:response regulator [Bacteroidales bacterium]